MKGKSVCVYGWIKRKRPKAKRSWKVSDKYKLIIYININIYVCFYVYSKVVCGLLSGKSFREKGRTIVKM